MKTVFDLSTQAELSKRINSLSSKNIAQWGKMDAYQMIRHCILCDKMFHGEIKIKRVFIGRLLGKMILNKVLKDNSPFGKNSPTSPLLKTVGTSGDIETEKRAWANSIDQYNNYNHTGFIHPFFGPMTREQIGLLVYKHTDHHLRQFGA
ncbi:MAG: DUF1569 domain-containing protein [Ferruginibacter sp.]